MMSPLLFLFLESKSHFNLETFHLEFTSFFVHPHLFLIGILLMTAFHLDSEFVNQFYSYLHGILIYLLVLSSYLAFFRNVGTPFLVKREDVIGFVLRIFLFIVGFQRFGFWSDRFIRFPSLSAMFAL